MTIYDFIFTKKSPGKYYRHIAFWGAQYIFWTFWATGFFIGLTELLKFSFRLNGAFILHAAYTYLIVYYFSPRYFETRRYTKFFLFVFVVTLLAYILYVTYLIFIFYGFTNYFKEFRVGSEHQQLLMTWYFSMNFIINGPPPVCAMFLTCKMIKNYYIKIEERQMLVKENANAEMQLLKAQVHPHFLFNTLNNIYSFALNRSPDAGKLVLKLKDTTRYMVYECDAALVPLPQEIKMLKDYIELERVRYGKRLELSINVTGDYQGKMITPLLMIPFVENSFKHGTSKMLRKSWIKLFIQTDKDVLRFSLINSKPSGENINGKKTCLPDRQGIGLLNVKKRLELLYPQNHSLLIESTESTFTVDMQIPLEKIQKEIVA